MKKTIITTILFIVFLISNAYSMQVKTNTYGAYIFNPESISTIECKKQYDRQLIIIKYNNKEEILYQNINLSIPLKNNFCVPNIATTNSNFLEQWSSNLKNSKFRRTIDVIKIPDKNGLISYEKSYIKDEYSVLCMYVLDDTLYIAIMDSKDLSKLKEMSPKLLNSIYPR